MIDRLFVVAISVAIVMTGVYMATPRKNEAFAIRFGLGVVVGAVITVLVYESGVSRLGHVTANNLLRFLLS